MLPGVNTGVVRLVGDVLREVMVIRDVDLPPGRSSRRFSQSVFGVEVDEGPQLVVADRGGGTSREGGKTTSGATCLTSVEDGGL